ncbi:translation elongation factor 1A GTP binding domain family [Archaeoglobus sulfaticallidus PM70-1]|uniref:Translation elongation factor 1A GTP binding domain family n=1 Tax=Archaeoglobus sulfaticallidus PM70-1 TaxID=387631 RepID=N0BMX8_9EURY|nr:GTPBP1 family GTP-binding protein [Archaeoglobus sulfaticallidus]AGK61630.1 translation elongation factor 1A GTP binding domain family [Archaeoglobus sulfaticallidus PM70-1]
MERILEIVKDGEKENIEFKEFLTDYHLRDDRFQTLACQMNHRILMGRGKAVYVVGISDSGELKGITHERFNKTLQILKKIASEIDAEVRSVEKYKINGGIVGIVEISKTRPKEHIIVGTAGHVDHGKSTLVGCLISGNPDDGSGATSIYLDTLKHEIERGLSADLSYAVLSFQNEGAIKMKNPLNKNERALMVEKADKIVSFIDTVGHEPWLRTTIRGLLGQKIDYGLLVVAANDGVMRTTKEHLGILIAMDLPVIIAITKADMVGEERVEEVINEISKTLRSVGRIPYLVKEKEDARRVARILSRDIIVPIIETSAITLKGYDILEELLYRLPKRSFHRGDFLMYIDRIYRVSGVGTVVSGTIKSGEIRAGEEVYIGPFHDGSFRKVRVQSIEMHYYRIERACDGDIVGLAIKGARFDELRRGMVLTKKEIHPVYEFLAEVYIFNHPTRIKRGYEPVLHLETISETVVFEDIEKEYMMAGERGKVRMKFKYHPYYICKGQKFIFREGKSKGMGEVVKVLD